MADFPKEFSRQGGEALATYNFTELASGESYIIWYVLGEQGTDPENEQWLTSSNINSSNSQRSVTSIDVDTTIFNITRTINGRVYFNINWDTDTTSSRSLSVRLYKVATDGTTETALTSEITGRTWSVNSAQILFVSEDVSDEKIQRNEKLRLKITVNGGSSLVNMGGSAGSNPQSFIAVPFKV